MPTSNRDHHTNVLGESFVFNFVLSAGWHLWSRESREADWQRSDSRPVVGGAVAAVVLVGEERALDKDTWLGLETLVTSWVWLVVDDWRLRAPAPWKDVPLLKVLTTSICGRRPGTGEDKWLLRVTKTKWQHRWTGWVIQVVKGIVSVMTSWVSECSIPLKKWFNLNGQFTDFTNNNTKQTTCSLSSVKFWIQLFGISGFCLNPDMNRMHASSKY